MAVADAETMAMRAEYMTWREDMATWRGKIEERVQGTDRRLDEFKSDFHRRMDKQDEAMRVLTELSEKTLAQALATNGRVTGHDGDNKRLTADLAEINVRVAKVENHGRFTIKQIVGGLMSLGVGLGGFAAIGTALHWF